MSKFLKLFNCSMWLIAFACSMMSAYIYNHKSWLFTFIFLLAGLFNGMILLFFIKDYLKN